RKVTLRVQYDYVKSDGNGDFTILNQAALTTLGAPTTAVPAQNNSNIDIPALDDYKKSSIVAKAMWEVTKYFSVVVGYAFEHYKYNDAAYDSYPSTYTFVDDNTTSNPKNPINTNYLTGAYANPSYNASLAFLTFTYKF
ncbi:MAG: MtrB/PioB family outer membrane beta-barrel protein, partial [Nitrospirae bacterium]|nr:MtrB/PioB family outer membrane beta-barrel protein [Nitrospirota bacterium]